jgi:hypothetical protein
MLGVAGAITAGLDGLGGAEPPSVVPEEALTVGYNVGAVLGCIKLYKREAPAITRETPAITVPPRVHRKLDSGIRSLAGSNLKKRRLRYDIGPGMGSASGILSSVVI